MFSNWPPAIAQKTTFSTVTWGNKCRSSAAGNFCSLWTTEEPKYSSGEPSLFDLWEPNPGKDINRHILAILFIYLHSIRKMPGLCAVLLFMCINDWVNLAFHSIMHWHGISGTSGRHDFFYGMKWVCCFLRVFLLFFFPVISFFLYYTNSSLSPLYQSWKLILVLIHTLRELLWFFSLCHRKLSDQDKGMCQAWRCTQHICVTTVHYCFSRLWPPIT